MNAQTAIASTVLKQSGLNHLPIMNQDNAEELGKISHLWLNLDTHKVESLTCKAGMLGRKTYTFKWSQIGTIGKDSLMISLSENPGAETHEGTTELVGYELWTDAGIQVGVIDDYLINPLNGEIIAYLFDTNGWLGTLDGQFQLPPTAIASVGSKRVIASMAAVRDAEEWTVGLTENMKQAKGRFSSLSAQFQEKGQQLSEQAKTQLTEVSGQLQEKGQQLSEQAKTQLTEVSGQLHERGQQLSGQAKTQLTEVSSQLREKSQQLGATVQAKASEAQTLLNRPEQVASLPESDVPSPDPEQTATSVNVPPQS